MDQAEVERIAANILEEGQQDPEEPPRLARLVVALMGPNAVDYASSLRGDGALVRIGDDWRIFVRHRLPLERRTFAIAHELAEWWMRVRLQYRSGDVEHAANGIAAAVLAPRPAFVRALRFFGGSLPELAEAFGVTESHAALREAEITHQPRALVSPALVRVRGPETFVWPDERTLRAWARRSRPGLRKTRLTDDPRRVVLDAEETG